MITGELKSKIDSVWNDFWSGGISNPLEVMEQLTYLLFIKGLDEKQTLAENKAHRTGKPIEDPIFPGGDFTPEGMAASRPYSELRWSRFKDLGSAQDMYDIVDNYVFPFLEERAADSSHARHMENARLTIPPRRCCRRRLMGLMRSRWRTATPRATCTSTCSPRSQRRVRTVSSVRLATSSSSWSR